MPERHTSDQLVDQATEALRDAIMAGRLRPGARLVQQQLAAELGISRTPLREALRRLEQQGLVTVLGNRGLAVTELSPEALLDTYEVREALDGLAARLAAERMGPGEVAELSAIHRRAREHVVDDWSPEGWTAANAEFHRLVMRGAHSPALERAMPAGRVSGQFLFPGIFLHQQRARISWQEHGKILEALRAHDTEAAEAAARAHIRRVRLALMEQIRRSTQAEPGLRRLQVLRPATTGKA